MHYDNGKTPCKSSSTCLCRCQLQTPLSCFPWLLSFKVLNSYIVFKAVSIPLENHVTSSFVSVLVHLLHTKNHNVLHSLPCHAAHHNKHATLTGTISLSLQSTWTFGAPVQTSLSPQNLHTLWFRSRVIIKARNLLQCHESGFGSAPLNLVTKCIKYDP